MIFQMEKLEKLGRGDFFMEPLFLTPYFRPKIWGGRKLNTVLGYDIPDGKVGEAWAR